MKQSMKARLGTAGAVLLRGSARYIAALAGTALVTGITGAGAADGVAGQDLVVSHTSIGSSSGADVAAAALREIAKSYVFPDAVAKINGVVTGHIRSGDYSRVQSPQELAALLTRHLQEATHDKHLVVTYSNAPIPATGQGGTATGGGMPSQAEVEAERKRLAVLNFGFQQVEVLDGNVGYLNLVGFAPAELGWDTAIAAMGMLANTDALIVDLRENTGGSPQMATLLSTYLLASQFKPVHLNDVYWRPTNSTDQYWTLPYVPGKLYAGKPVYLLTGPRTFSTAEEFAYDLKALNRVTIIGEATAGGAHVGTTHRLPDHFAIFIPSGRSLNPVTGTNWEGTGIQPDLPISAASALALAHVRALGKLIEGAPDDAAKDALRPALARAQHTLEK